MGINKSLVGRNYEDCAPVKGVYKGNQTQLMNVNVHLGTKRKTKNFELSNKQNLDNTNFENNKQNSFRKNLEMIQLFTLGNTFMHKPNMGWT